MITASELLALPDAHKIDKIHHAFTESYKYVCSYQWNAYVNSVAMAT